MDFSDNRYLFVAFFKALYEIYFQKFLILAFLILVKERDCPASTPALPRSRVGSGRDRWMALAHDQVKRLQKCSVVFTHESDFIETSLVLRPSYAYRAWICGL